MLKYKLLTQEMTSFGCCKWTIGETKRTSGVPRELCTEGWLHYYDDPVLAVMMNPIHAEIKSPRCFEVECSGKVLEGNGTKGGCTEMMLLREIDLPDVTLEQRCKFSILAALEVYTEESFVAWANNWLSGTDRSASASHDAADAAHAARAAAHAAHAAAHCAADAAHAARAAAHAADAAAHAADAAAHAADAAHAARAAAHAADAADAAAIYSAVYTNTKLDLVKLAKKAMEG